jgi:hypothetical protein
LAKCWQAIWQLNSLPAVRCVVYFTKGKSIPYGIAIDLQMFTKETTSPMGAWEVMVFL